MIPLVSVCLYVDVVVSRYRYQCANTVRATYSYYVVLYFALSYSMCVYSVVIVVHLPRLKLILNLRPFYQSALSNRAVSLRM